MSPTGPARPGLGGFAVATRNKVSLPKRAGPFLISFDRNRFSVLAEAARRAVEVRA